MPTIVEREGKTFDLDEWGEVRPGVAGTVLWVGPTWATLCGVIASGTWSEVRIGGALTVLIVVLLAGPVSGAIIALALALGVTVEGRREVVGELSFVAGKRLPYAVPGSGAARLSHVLANTRGRWAARLRAPAAQYVAGIAVVSTIALVLGALLNGTVLLAVASAVALALILGVLGCTAGKGEYWLLFSSQITLGWLLGHGAVGELDYLSVVMSTALGATYWATLSCTGERRGLRVNLSYGFQLIGSTLLVLAGLPVAAGGLLLLLCAQVLFRDGEWDGALYAERVQPLIMLTMLIASIALGSCAGR